MDTPNTQNGESRPPLALIAGPTASGKSALAIALAERTGGIVINADASQVYRDLSLLSARPSPEEVARAPHRLFGHIDGAEACSAPRWAAEAKAEIAAAHAAGKLPILVGGTGLYIRTLLDGIAPVPEIDPEIRTEVRTLPVAETYAALTREDPAAAARLAAADTSRVARALEVVRSTGRTLAGWQAHKEGGIGESIALRPMILVPPRGWLIARCDMRFEAMIDQGAEEEVRTLLTRNLNPMLPVMRAIGVREVAAWIDGKIDRETMLERGCLATRQYAKRQYTWFSNQPPPQWYRMHQEIHNNNMDELVTLLRN
ncbi:MAG: tRNA (adenosine(37)-N6)-dimethylallyltransferase MiaA [Sphingobium sp.]